MNKTKESSGYQYTTRRLAKHLGLHIVRSNQFFIRRMQQEVMTPSQATVLNFLLDERAWRISDLASAAGVRVPSMTELVTRMERLGWLRKTETSHDRRGVEVTLTDEGRRLIQGYERRNIDLIAQRLTMLSDEEKSDIERALPALQHLFGTAEDL